jgi:hypothetical protein
VFVGEIWDGMGVGWDEVPRATGPERFISIVSCWRGTSGSRQGVVVRVTVAAEVAERRAKAGARDVGFILVVCLYLSIERDWRVVMLYVMCY